MLLTAYGRDKASDYINRLDLHIESTGKCYQSHYATIKKWIAEDESKAKQAVAPKPTQNRFANHHQREYDPDQLKQLERAYLRN